MKAKTLWLFLLISSGLSSCFDQPLIDQNQTIDERRWSREYEPEFSLAVTDTAVGYDVFLNLRNSIAYQFSDIYLQIQQKNPDSSKVRYAIKIKMTNSEGLWVGKGSGNLYSQQVRFLRNYHFPDSGTYIFKIKQNMRTNPLVGIHNVGIRVAASTP